MPRPTLRPVCRRAYDPRPPEHNNAERRQGTPMNAPTHLLQVRGVSKSLGGRAILRDVSIIVDPVDL